MEKNKSIMKDITMYHEGCRCSGCRKNDNPKEEPSPSSGNLDADFANLCGEILMGKTKDADVKRITKEMCDAGRSIEMRNELIRIGNILKTGEK
jgi:hypothetical protein